MRFHLGLSPQKQASDPPASFSEFFSFTGQFCAFACRGIGAVLVEAARRSNQAAEPWQRVREREQTPAVA